MQPGSMPSDSRSIYQEGIIIPPVRLVRGGEYVDDVLALLLANVRTPEIRLADLQAQMAANRVGAERFGELIDRHGLEFVRAAFDDVLAYSERRTRAALAALPDGTLSRREPSSRATASPTTTSRSAARRRSTATASGSTSPAPRRPPPGNVNCPLAVTRSACLFAVRVLLPDDIPTNAGIVRAIEVARAAGLPGQRRAAGRGRRRQRRDEPAHRRRRARGARRRRSSCPPPGRGR